LFLNALYSIDKCEKENDRHKKNKAKINGGLSLSERSELEQEYKLEGNSLAKRIQEMMLMKGKTVRIPMHSHIKEKKNERN